MTDFEKSYFSSELFPFFANRLIPKSRPEYPQYLRWLGFEESPVEPMKVLAVTGGLRATDSYELIQPPESTSEGYCVDFFSRGLRYLTPSATERIDQLSGGDRLYPMQDIQNAQDRLAIALRTGDPKTLVGYLPRYYAPGVGKLLALNLSSSVVVKQVNHDAPLDMRLLCTLRVAAHTDSSILEHSDDFAPAVGDSVDAEDILRRTALEL
jgi:hypothetical protein